MIPRYTRPEMARIWSDENRFRTWLAVEVAATETLAISNPDFQRSSQFLGFCHSFYSTIAQIMIGNFGTVGQTCMRLGAF